MTNKWQHQITIYSPEDILRLIQQSVEESPPQIFCDDEGACYFDDGPNPYTHAIEQLLDAEGQAGWELVDVTFRPNQAICIWKRPA